MSVSQREKMKIPFKKDDFYSSQHQREEQLKETIENVDISLIDGFINHPFKLNKDKDFNMLKESVRTIGLIEPIIIRKKDDGRYEIISGHRRKLACEELDIKIIPCYIKDLNDNQATMFMVDSNLHREKILPSEKAFAYKMKNEAIKHQGIATLSHDGAKIRSVDLVGKDFGDSGREVQRYIRLTYLIPELLDLVDNTFLNPRMNEKRMALTPAVEISYLSYENQKILFQYIEKNLSSPSHAQARRIRKLSEEGNLTSQKLQEILGELKPNQVETIKFKTEKIYSVIPKQYRKTPEDTEHFVIKACEHFTKVLEARRNRER